MMKSEFEVGNEFGRIYNKSGDFGTEMCGEEA
jgi:hypothetical protein